MKKTEERERERERERNREGKRKGKGEKHLYKLSFRELGCYYFHSSHEW